MDSSEQPSNIHSRTTTKGVPRCLAPSGVYLAGIVTYPAGALLPHPFTLTTNHTIVGAVYFLLHSSRGSPRVVVNNHRALWSPDFPRINAWRNPRGAPVRSSAVPRRPSSSRKLYPGRSPTTNNKPPNPPSSRVCAQLRNHIHRPHHQLRSTGLQHADPAKVQERTPIKSHISPDSAS